MQTIRNLELKAKQLFDQNVIRGVCHLYAGQEACAVGINAAIKATDRLITGYRCHAFTLMRGGPLRAIVAELAGRKTGISKGRGGSMHMFTKTFYGGYGVVGSQGQVAETMNMAALWKLPIIFVCENNKYAKGTSMERCTVNRNFYKRGDIIPGLRVDGMDILCVREATRFASDHCRTGKGPIVMELQTYRYYGHHQLDNESMYRSVDEVDEVRRTRDPISQLEGYIIRNNLAITEELRQIDDEIKKDVEEATRFAIRSPEPLVEELCNHIYCNHPMQDVRGINSWAKLKSGS
ncbi:pyruvate dehydrogenase E1 component subunit alpha, somatic form, mitochondrial-like isoform X2 [Corythoichthys intestinalis]|uniref:pyruvate dehydrogenase E1 component subunit alpha, somatic form, mitochondrial-like isoform X2 n=1 Tax=Corythoichthys intestinalis TaxID=161448 RepID=UPI0025A53B8F|nr:pyruvate dehydrogenase E1 component subunit alpha, somatic form, mitochondrial-like isoform X2 [Corythoichthys intestinalis]XP_061801347.1 pyruvate dehydrogenase E1 component subunit alpha, somatic form, mitochondrial-like isoform X2 [Nerophis lumbriciformis]